MVVTMKETRRGSEDGFSVKRFDQGESYDMRDSLACEFINRGWAVESNRQTPTVFEQRCGL